MADHDIKKDRSERTVLTNMCMVNREGDVLVLDKVGGGYTGTTFPGGHIEEGESFHGSVIREVAEETGLLIEDPVLAGTYQWYEDDRRNILFLYMARTFTGELRDSPEGRVRWIPLSSMVDEDLAEGMEDVLSIMTEGYDECVCTHDDEGRYKGKLYGKGRKYD